LFGGDIGETVGTVFEASAEKLSPVLHS
jgi:hypothetical protein